MESSKRKTPLQIQVLQNIFNEEQYPSRSAMEDYAKALGLTYKQVRYWFIEKRRREKSKKAAGALGLSNHSAEVSKRNKKKNKKEFVQVLLSTDYILEKIFRKDGPPLGVEFDSLPSQAFSPRKSDHRISRSADTWHENAEKRRKVSEVESGSRQVPSNNDTLPRKHGMGKGLMSIVPVEEHRLDEGLMTRAPARHGMGKGLISNGLVNKQGVEKGLMNNAPAKKHGRGKGLMAVWRLTNPEGGDLPTGFHLADSELCGVSDISNSPSCRPKRANNRRKQVVRKIKTPSQGKPKPLKKAREVKYNEDENQMHWQKEKCELALEGLISQERLDQIAMLADDEEVELRELQTGPNPLTCSDHFAANGLCTCSLCKGLLAKFPPDSVKTKQPFSIQPWSSSPDMVKKLFRIFQFLYTHAVTVNLCSFTLDEFAQAFHDKDSMLLGKIHVALLTLLLSDVESDISGGVLPHLSKSCKFLALLHSVESREYVLQLWKKSLNPLTWVEILRQVLVSAGFGSKQGATRNNALSKEGRCFLKYGLSPGTLKGEIFRILSEQGSCGMKVPDLAKSLPIAELNLASDPEQLEDIICSMLSSDITLFEKISPSAYRLRVGYVAKETDDFNSDTEDSGSVDDDPVECDNDSSGDESECSSEITMSRKRKHMNHSKSKNSMLTVSTEIDESHPEELWLLGLKEGEYSDLSIEEKLNALVALTDLLSAGSSFRTEDAANAIASSVPGIYQYGNGAKIKRPSARQHSLAVQSSGHDGAMHGVLELCSSLECQPVDSLALISKSNGVKRLSTGERKTESASFPHSMRSVYLGSDRRYNRYWLFLGPCDFHDPGHRRVYFESSEDGHWEVIDNEEVFRALLSVLDVRGKREAFLIESLEKHEAFLCNAMSRTMTSNSSISQSAQSDQSGVDIVREESSPISDIDNNLCLSGNVNDSSLSPGAIVLGFEKGEEQRQKWIRLQELDAWIWNCFYSDLNAVKYSKRSYFDSLMRCRSCHDLYWRDERHCRKCHKTFELDFDLEERYAIHAATCREQEEDDAFPKHKVLPSQLQALKAAVYAIESNMPEGALLGAWIKSAHKLWIKRLRRTSSLAELSQVISDFLGAICEDWLYHCNVAEDPYIVADEVVASFATLPPTSSAIALWLVKLDAIVLHNQRGAFSETRRGPSSRGNHAQR